MSTRLESLIEIIGIIIIVLCGFFFVMGYTAILMIGILVAVVMFLMDKK